MLGPSSLCSLHDRPVNPRDEVLRQEETLVGELADQQDGRLAPQNNHLIGVWMPSSFMDQTLGSGQGNKAKKAINFANISENGKPQARWMCRFQFPPAIYRSTGF